MKSQVLQFALGLSLAVSGAYAYAAENPKDLLEEADRARGASKKGMSWTVKIDTTEGDDKESTTYKVRSAMSNANVELTEPPKDKGQKLLFNDRTIWFYKPSLKKPVAISARQKLSGQAANGDIASTNSARDYEGKIIGEEKVNGEDCYVLDLKAIGENTTYDGIKYWISKKKKLGVKADFLSLQGKSLKTAEFKYDNSLSVGGKKIDFVSEMKVVDSQNKKNFSVMTYTSPKVEAAPESLFNVNNLLR